MGQRWVGNGGKDGLAWGLGRRQVEEERKKNEREKRRMVALVSKWAWEMAWINESGGREKKI